ncbi:DNA methyltransferase [Parabacteroides sp. AM08-6]|uniref:Eco57I restriction-modification methylase domain-containing protein n=1 Tax=Parabacteroides sp. AM08-6 TaxID=2292053 RepID=UPI001314C4EB|nr:DNA methyltransferase [Parabacteroides sp. AM08-6]
MKNGNLLNRLGFSDNELDRKTLLFPHNERLSDKLGTVSYYGKDKSEQVKTRFYWIKAEDMSLEDIKAIHERIWNENKADLLFLEKANSVEIKYINTSPKDDLLDIVQIPTNVEDNELLDKISKEHITTGAFWIEYNNALERIRKQHKTVDQALVESLCFLREKLDDIYKPLFSDKTARSNIVQALIDRTLFIKFLEDKKIINSNFYYKYFGNSNIHYKDILLQKDARRINELFHRINEVFNNKLFETPTIKDDDLIDSALTAIAYTISGSIGGQLSLFDFQFDVIPIEFISHIYQIFLDDKKSIQGIFYTPEGLANLVLDNVLHNPGRILDPSCGSGIFLVLAFRKMYTTPSGMTSIYDRIQHRLKFIQENIFGIEIENTAARLAVFSLYLEVLNDITAAELNKLVAEIITSEDSKQLFSIDFSDNIQEKNALEEGCNSAFASQKFDYIVGNPPWFVISKTSQNINDEINYSYWDKYRNYFTLERQISQCFLHRIKEWSTNETKFGFIVNSSNFTNTSDSFQNFIFSTYRLKRIFELYHVKDILFDYAKEPACLLIFDNHIANPNLIEYFLPRLNSFAETFRTILLNQKDVLYVRQEELLNKKIRLRDYLIGTEAELSLANKLEKECKSIIDLLLIDERYDSYRGFSDWGESALKKEFNEDKNLLSKDELELRKQTFIDKYYNSIANEEYNIPFVKSANLERFIIKNINSYCRNDISNFDRPRNNFVYTGEKILCSRIGGEIKAVYSNNKVYFGTDIYVIKLQDPELYHTIVCCLNSELLNYFSQIKLRKRIDSSLSRLDSSDIKKIPIPKRFNKTIVEKLTLLSREISEGVYLFEEKKDELNELVCDLYDFNCVEKQRVADFFVSKDQKITKEVLEDYCHVFFKTIRRFLKTGITKFEYSYNSSLPFDIAGVKITFGENGSDSPQIDKVRLSINHQLLKLVGNTVLVSLKERIYSEDSIFIMKDLDPKNWTKSAAYDDAKAEIKKLLQL